MRKVVLKCDICGKVIEIDYDNYDFDEENETLQDYCSIDNTYRDLCYDCYKKLNKIKKDVGKYRENLIEKSDAIIREKVEKRYNDKMRKLRED